MEDNYKLFKIQMNTSSGLSNALA